MKTQTRIGLAVALALALLAGLAPRAGAAVTASGGNYTNNIPGYRIHVFTNSATASNFVVSAASPGDTVQVLVVGGGGAGGGVNNGGGGGAGGFIYSNGYSVVAGNNYIVTVGVGGPANAGATPVAGSNSVFGTITATGGGGGGGGNGGQGGGDGGSGGGGAYSSGPKGNRTPSPIQGNDGAAGVNDGSIYPAGGGGGAGAPASGAQGGTGTNCSITGYSVWYAGGGSGGRNSTVVTGGQGGGGNGAGNSPGNIPATAGQPNTGGGGGGCQTSSSTGGSGGSGIVIVRYPYSPNPWAYSMPISFTNDARLNTLTNFPALVIFDTNKVNYGQFLANGQDLRFMDGNGNELMYEVESWMSSGAPSNSFIWVQIPTMTAGCSITAYWGNASAAFPSYRTNGTVWVDGYALVEHMAISNGTTVADATPNGNTATIYNEYGYTPTGMIGSALNLSRTADRNNGLQLVNSVSIGNNWAISCWFNGLLGTGDWRTLARGPTGNHQVLVEDASTRLGSYMGGFSQYGSATLPTDSNWRHIMVVGSAGTSAAYVNGQLIGTGSFQSTEAVKSIGYLYTGSQKFASYLDEVRIDIVARSSNWVWACYANQGAPAAFTTCGAVSSTAAPASTYKLKMAFTNYTRAEVLTNFPVLVTFSNGLYGTFNYNTFTAPATGGDLRFMDSTESTYLDFEIEKWATNDASYVWVRVPQLSSNTTIYAKWGGSDTNLPACTTNGAVWESNFKGVWHFPNGGTFSAQDSTANLNHGTPTNMTAGTGPIGGAGTFNGSNTTATGSYVQTPVVSTANTSVTLSAWINTANGNQDGQGILFNGSDKNSNGYGMFVNKESVTSGNLYILYGGIAWWDTGKGITQNAWHHIAITLSADGKTTTAYVDGLSVGANTFGSAPNAPTLETDIGRDNFIATYHRSFYGLIDEPRVANTIRSANWVWAEYANVASNAFFNGYGTVQAPTSAGTITLQPVANLTTNSVQLTATLTGTSADLYAYWDTQDRGTNFTWAYTNSPLTAFANTAAGTTITNTASGLTPGTAYAYRFYGTNTTSGWSGWSSAGSFITPGPPTVDNSTNGASGIAVGTATLNGRVTATNSAVCYGKFFWGPTDGSNNPTAWACTNDIAGTVAQGVPFSVSLSNLLYGQQYYYRAAASNGYGLSWATNSVGFLTTRPPTGRILPISAVPVAWYRFDSPANFGLDSSTNGFNMTVYNSPVAAADAKFSGAVAWSNALSQYMQLTGSAWTTLQNKLTNTTGQTAVMWVKKASGQIAQQNTSGIMRGLGSGSNDHYTWNDSPNPFAYFMDFGSARMNSIPQPSSANQQVWHMIALVRDPNDSSTGRRVYFLTNSVATAAATAAPGTLTWGADFTIGLNGNNNYFGGSMDDFMLFDRALSTNDLSALYSDAGTIYASVSISNLTASSGTSTSAVLSATLQGTGSVFNVSAYYWVVGAASSNVAAVGTFTNAAATNLSVTVTNLTPGMSYAYTFLASNAATNLWATPAVGFGTVDVNVQATDPTGRVTLADTAAFTVYRPAAATNGDLTVNYTLGGTATNGVNYTNSPAASGTNGTVTILSGQTNAVITVCPLNLGAPQQTVVLTIASGGYVIGSANSATCTLAAATTWVAGSNRYWVAAGPGNWNNAANWSFAPYGAGGWSVPASTNVAIFDGSGAGNCTMDTAVNVAGIVLTNGYAGTVTQASTTPITVGASGWNQWAGTFSGGTNSITLNGSWSLAGGTFNAGGQTITMNNGGPAVSWAYSGGTFNAGSSTVSFFPDWNAITISGSQSFNNLTLNGVYNTHIGTVTVPAGTTLSVTNTLSLYDGSSDNRGVAFSGTGTIAAQGNITATYMRANNAYAGTVLLLINGAGDQTFTNGGASMTKIEINKSGGTLSLAGTFTVGNDANNASSWTYTAGTLNVGTSTIYFIGENGGLTISGSHTLNNVYFPSVGGTHGNTITLSAGTILTASGTLTFNASSGGSKITLNTGTLEAQGDVSITSSAVCDGSAVLKFAGAANQQVSHSGTPTYFRLSPVTVNKTGGALNLVTDLSLGYTGQQLVWTNGAINLSSNTLTVAGATTIYPGATTLGVGIVDSNKAGRLTCNSALSGLTNLALAMAVSATEAQLSGQTYLIVTNTAALSSPFESVSWPGLWTGDIDYTPSGGKAVTVANVRQQALGGAPTILNQPVTGVTDGGATFNGRLVSNGTYSATVFVLWGETNGAVSGSWANTNSWSQGAWPDNSYPSTNLTLAANRNYYYAFGAANLGGQTITPDQKYLITGDLTVQATDPTGRGPGNDTAAFTVYRPATCTNEDLAVNYTLSGTAASPADYTIAPVSGAVILAKGQTNGLITVTPVYKESLAQTVVLTLTPGAYAIGAMNSATCTLATVAGTNRYWVAAAPGNWSDSNNWSFLSGQPGGYSVPGSGSLAVFDSGGAGNCAMDAAVNVAGIRLTNGYAGTLTQSPLAPITVGASGWAQSAGTFTGSTNALTLNGPWSLSGGTFNAGNQTIAVNPAAGNWTYSGGTFNAGSSTVSLFADNSAITISGSNTFNNLTMNGVFSTHTATYTVPTGTTNTVTGTLSLLDGGAGNAGFFLAGTGTIAAQGNITASYLRAGNGYVGTVLLLINGAGDQTFTNAGATLANIKINKPSGTLSLAGTHVVGGGDWFGNTYAGSWTYTAGALNAGASTITFFGDTPGLTISGSHTLGNVSFVNVGGTHQNTITMAAGTTLTAAGTLTFNAAGGGSSIPINTGTLNAQGDVSFSMGTACSGSAALTFTGAATQQVSYAGTPNYFQLSPVTVNKTGGALTLATDLNLGNTGQQLVWTNGALNLSSNTLTVAGAVTIHPGATTLGVTVADGTKAGRLTCSSAVTNIAHVGLVVNVAATEAQVVGQTYTIVSNANVLGAEFESVAWLDGWSGVVAYTANGGKNVTLSSLSMTRGTVFTFR